MKLTELEKVVLNYAKENPTMGFDANTLGWSIELFSVVAKGLDQKGLIQNCIKVDQNVGIIYFDVREYAMKLV